LHAARKRNPEKIDMAYRWGDYSLDRTGSRLTRLGESVDVSRKVLHCIDYLLANRQRVVGYEELYRAIWNHGNVTNHQLAQVMLAARRAIGDDGQAQRLIRTASGVGYQWIGAVIEVTATDAAIPGQGSDAPLPIRISEAVAAPETRHPPLAPVSASISDLHAARTAWYRSGTLRLGIALMLALIAVTSIRWQQHNVERAVATPSPVAGDNMDSLSSLWEALWKGQFEDVREGFAALPADLADSPDARLLEIRLDIERGRFDSAAQKLALQQARAKAAADPVWQSQLSAMQAFLSGSAGRPGPETLAPGQLAVKLLETAGTTSPPRAMGEALSARGYGLMKTQQFEPAIRDLVRARTLLFEAGDKRGAANAGDTLARVQMRTGHLKEALALMTDIASYCQQSHNPVQEIYARNAATKIQIELLRWSDALASSNRSMQLLQTVPDSERRTRVVLLHALVLTDIGRLREAASLIEEAEAMHDHRYSTIIPAVYHLASGQAQQALTAASQAATFNQYNVNENLNLESTEGALLLWVIAAQNLAANGNAMPEPSPAQLKALQQPESDIGHIARGRWLWSQGKPQSAEAQFRLGLAKARQQNMLRRMLLACEPLIELLLQRGDTAAAVRTLAELHAYDPDRLDQDYQANLLGLRVALALGERNAITAAYQRTTALAGERTLPARVLLAHDANMRAPDDHKSIQNTASRF
jgi:DNA-binding winged helix-turn-helix (wHTH) protein/tetratricopeptide (TPR) repeat protein